MTNFKINKVRNATMIWVNNVIKQGFQQPARLILIHLTWIYLLFSHSAQVLWPGSKYQIKNKKLLSLTIFYIFLQLKSKYRSALLLMIILKFPFLSSRFCDSWWNQLDRKLDFLFNPLNFTYIKLNLNIIFSHQISINRGTFYWC